MKSPEYYTGSDLKFDIIDKPVIPKLHSSTPSIQDSIDYVEARKEYEKLFSMYSQAMDEKKRALSERRAALFSDIAEEYEISEEQVTLATKYIEAYVGVSSSSVARFIDEFDNLMEVVRNLSGK